MNVPWQGKGGLGPGRGRQLPPAGGLGAFLNLTQNPAWALQGQGRDGVLPEGPDTGPCEV